MTDKAEPASSSPLSLTAVVSIIAACIAAGAAVSVAALNAAAQRNLEREQFQSNLMLRAIDPADRKRSIDGIRFLIEAGFVSEKNEKVLKVLQDTSFHIPLSTEKLAIPAPSKAHYDYSTALSSNLTPTSSRERLKQRRTQLIPYGLANSRPTFSGIIVDELTNKPLAGATVAALTSEAPESMITGSDGKFTLHYPYKPWALWVKRPGYQIINQWETPNMTFPRNIVISLKMAE